MRARLAETPAAVAAVVVARGGARARRPTSRPPLAGELDVDVAIVGGGYTGLWTALALREREPSLSVALLEAREIGDGPSGRNGGFLHGYWSSLPTLRRVLGDGAALQLAHASARIVPEVRAFCESRGEDVWLREGGLLQRVGRRVRGLRRRARSRGRARARRRGGGARCSMRPRRGVAATRRASAAASIFRDGATVQPARLVLALQRAAIDGGVQLFEHTPVTARPRGSPTGSRRPAASSARARSCSP